MLVLWIEDEQDYVRAFRRRLADEDIQSFVAPTLESGLRELRSARNYDAVILDLALPDSQGETTYMRVRAVIGSAPLIVLTAAVDMPARDRMVLEGAHVLDKAEANMVGLIDLIKGTVWEARMQQQSQWDETTRPDLRQDAIPLTWLQEVDNRIKPVADGVARLNEKFDSLAIEIRRHSTPPQGVEAQPRSIRDRVKRDIQAFNWYEFALESSKWALKIALAGIMIWQMISHEIRETTRKATPSPTHQPSR